MTVFCVTLQCFTKSIPRTAQHPNVLLDHEYVAVHRASDIDAAALAYPVRAVFSRGRRPARFRGKIEFRDVHFSYPADLRKKVLNGLSFTVEPGQKVALVGATGCGKSSCMSLLQRLYQNENLRLFDPQPVAFKCSCSRERTLAALASIGEGEIRSILDEQGSVTMDCEFCNQRYVFSPEDLQDLLSTPGTASLH